MGNRVMCGCPLIVLVESYVKVQLGDKVFGRSVETIDAGSQYFAPSSTGGFLYLTFYITGILVRNL